MKIYNFGFTHYPSEYLDRVVAPCVLLLSDSWDDYGYKTYFNAYFVDSNKDIINLGGLRILDRNNDSTYLLNEFDKLENNFCSLAASMDYYEKLGNLGKDVYVDILYRLRDAAYYSEIKADFYDLGGFQSSLLRDISSRNTLENAKAFLDKAKMDTRFDFEYTTQLPAADEPHKVSFKFDKNDDLPFRIIALIGKNGTGKSAVLSDLAYDLTEAYEKELEKFKPQKPVFGKLITISYSVFGGFEKKKSDKQDEIVYQNFGVLNEENVFSQDFMNNNLHSSIDRIKEFERVDTWLLILSELNSEEFIEYIKVHIIENSNYSFLKTFSSGQRMIFEIITNIVGSIRKNSLIIFDEPEIHLHPNAIALLLKSLYFILEEFDSYAIIATHVPHVVQQIPSKSVVVFDRIGNTPSVRPLNIECFGENLTTITNEIFETMNVFDNYKTVLKELAREMSYERVSELFSNRLPLNARVFLKSLY